MKQGSATDTARKFLKGIEGHTIAVGWMAGNVYPGTTMPVAMVAYFNEYGAHRGEVEIPARHPMRTTIDRHSGDIKAFMRRAIAAGVQGKLKSDVALNNIGQFAVSQLQDVIGSNLPAPNAESTVHGVLNPKTGERAGSAQKENRTWGQGKGFSRTLVDTGQMMNTATYTVEKD